MARRLGPTVGEFDGPEDEEPDASAVGATLSSAARSERMRRGVAVSVGGGETDAEDEHAWMTTYTDMVTLLLTCFIMLISLASFSDPKAVQSLVPSGVDPVETPPVADERPLAEMPDALFLRQPPDTWSARLSRDLERFVATAPAVGGMTVVRAETSVTVRLSDRLLFPSGRVELNAEGLALLQELAPILAASPARIDVQGHTDSIPIASWLFPSNWELSGARAAAVVRALVEGGIAPRRLEAIGLADTVPLADNDTPEGRQANRRVELVLRTPFDPPDSASILAPKARR